jgi:hypothetical protein
VNVEAGTDPEENRVLAVTDRVNTMGTVFLGSTIGCAQCHNHKYDPFTQVEYYKLLAYFNNTEAEIEPSGSRRTFTGPSLSLPVAEESAEKKVALERQIESLEARLSERTKQARDMEERLASAGGEIAELLLQQGYRRLGYMAGPPSGSTRLERVSGFTAVLQRRGLELDLVLEAGSYQRQQGYKTLTAYLKSSTDGDRIEALFCENDNLAIGALDALRDWGQGVEIAVVGFDGIELGASASYRLTTYQQPIELLASEAIRKLPHSNEEQSRFLAPGKLIIRSSHLRSP